MLTQPRARPGWPRWLASAAIGAAAAGVCGALLGFVLRANLLGAVTGLLAALVVAPFAALATATILCFRIPTRTQALALLLAPLVSAPAWFGSDRGGMLVLASQARCSSRSAEEILARTGYADYWDRLAEGWAHRRPPRSCMFFGLGHFRTFVIPAPAWRITTADSTSWATSTTEVERYRSGDLGGPSTRIDAFDEPALCIAFADEWGNNVTRCAGADGDVDAFPTVVTND